jgi:hypothetical protein
MLKALIITPEGEARTEEVDGPDYKIAAWINQTVGGYFEAIMTPRFLVYCDEDGKRHNARPNPIATRIVMDANPAFNQVIVGTVVIFGTEKIPEESDAPEDVIVLATTLAEIIKESIQQARKAAQN